MDFGRYAAPGNAFVREVAAALEARHDIERAERMLRSVLQALRDRMTPDESLRLVSQLPEYLKGLYVDGWRLGLADVPASSRDVDGFVAKVLRLGGGQARADFGRGSTARRRVQAVLGVLKRHLTNGTRPWAPLAVPREVEALWASA